MIQRKIFIALSFLAFFFQSSFSKEPFLRGMQFDVGYAVGKYITIGEHLELSVFTPFALTDTYISFADLRGYRFDDGRWATSAGFGLRTAISDHALIGINTYYDYRRGWSRGDFQQVGWGLEWLNCCYEFRINGYLPVGAKSHQHRKVCSFDLGDGFHATRRRLEFSYGGFDAEVSVPVKNCYGFNLYGGLGPYYYSRAHKRSFWGGFGRLELDWQSLFSAELIYSYDRKHSSHFQAIFRLSIPFSFCDSRACGCCDLTCNRVYRNGIILLDRCCDWTWNW